MGVGARLANLANFGTHDELRLVGVGAHDVLWLVGVRALDVLRLVGVGTLDVLRLAAAGPAAIAWLAAVGAGSLGLLSVDVSSLIEHERASDRFEARESAEFGSPERALGVTAERRLDVVRCPPDSNSKKTSHRSHGISYSASVCRNLSRFGLRKFARIVRDTLPQLQLFGKKSKLDFDR